MAGFEQVKIMRPAKILPLKSGDYTGGHKPGMRMGARMNFAQLDDGYVGVNLGGVEAGVSVELLNEPDVGTVFEQVGGAGVTEEMTASGAADVGFFDGAPDPVA